MGPSKGTTQGVPISVARLYHYLLDKNVEFGTRATVKMARVDNDAPVSDQGCHIYQTDWKGLI
jgi:hypothetical protein